MKSLLISAAAIAFMAASSTVSYAGGQPLSPAQQQALTQMALQVFGGPPTQQELGPNGVYYGASITHSVSEQPAGRHDCVVVDRQGNVLPHHNRPIGVWQRWRCPHLGN